MKLRLIAAAVACLLASVPVHAQEGFPFALHMSGGQFLSLCTNPPPDRGPEVVAMCQMYVAGIADALKADNRVCFGPLVTQRKLFSAAAWWIDSRPREGYQAGVMIRNGLLNAFRCTTIAQRRAYIPPPDARLEHNTKVMEFWTAAAHLLLLFAVH